MVQYLRQPSPNIDFDPPCSIFSEVHRKPCIILELGSGNGYVGSYLARGLFENGRTTDTLVVTDLPDVCSLLEENVTLELRKAGISRDVGTDTPNVLLHPLAWGVSDDATKLLSLLSTQSRDPTRSTEFPTLTHIVCSDLVYFPHLLAPLLRSLLQVTAPPFVCREQLPEVLISYKVRSLTKETPFWSAFGLWFSFKPVIVRRKTNPQSRSSTDSNTQWGNWHTYGIEEDTSFLFSAFRLPESYGWIVPISDEELLSGVGARGTLTPKSDDTFENIILMGMDLDE